MFWRPFSGVATMNDLNQPPVRLGWTRAETRQRQISAGLRMTLAERLTWLEEVLDELLPLIGRARDARPAVMKDRS